MNDTDSSEYPDESVVTHFGSLNTERISPEIRLEDLPGNENISDIVTDFMKSLKSGEPYSTAPELQNSRQEKRGLRRK